MKEPIFFQRNDTLSHDQALYWKDLLYRAVKIGTELEFALPKGKRKQELLPALVKALTPSQELTKLGRYGVLDIVSEHCGLEIQIIGRQPYYTALLEQYRAIFALLPAGIRARPTCGLHFHALTPGLGEDVPVIVLGNLWNLVRRYAPELAFLTSGGASRSALRRRRNYNSHQELVKLSPVPHTMPAIQRRLRESNVVAEHNNFLNLEHLTFSPTGDVDNFHVEFRFPDADLSTTSIVAKTFLLLALILKAVELSQYGIIHVGRIRPWRRKIQLLDWLSNNDGPLATSDTRSVTPEVVEELRSGSREMLELLKPIFDRWEGNPSFEVLTLLTETPISLLRVSGRTWAEIEQLLAERAASDELGLDRTDHRLMQAIEVAQVTGAPSMEAWQWTIARELLLTPRELEERMERLDQLRGLRWDTRLGTMAFRL